MFAVTRCLPLAKAALGEGPRDPFRAADQLDHDLDGRVGGERPRIVPPVETVERDPAILALVARMRPRPASIGRPVALLEQRGVVAQQREHAAADRTQPGNADT